MTTKQSWFPNGVRIIEDSAIIIYTTNGLTSNGIEGAFVNNFGTLGIDTDLVTKIGGATNKYKIEKVLIDCGKGSIWQPLS